jgi:hypothetical protein
MADAILLAGVSAARKCNQFDRPLAISDFVGMAVISAALAAAAGRCD